LIRGDDTEISQEVFGGLSFEDDGVSDSGSADFSQVIDLKIEGSVEEFNQIVERLGLEEFFQPFSGIFGEVVIKPIVVGDEDEEGLLGELGKTRFESDDEFLEFIDGGRGEIFAWCGFKVDFSGREFFNELGEKSGSLDEIGREFGDDLTIK